MAAANDFTLKYSFRRGVSRETLPAAAARRHDGGSIAPLFVFYVQLHGRDSTTD
jgi:hypothetical protein